MIVCTGRPLCAGALVDPRAPVTYSTFLFSRVHRVPSVLSSLRLRTRAPSNENEDEDENENENKNEDGWHLNDGWQWTYCGVGRVCTTVFHTFCMTRHI
jgi:hypothetical protein